jgi:hypothetical protein
MVVSDVCAFDVAPAVESVTVNRLVTPTFVSPSTTPVTCTVE